LTLVPGERLGSYEIVSLLGADGMGVVYRARDAHLQRTVALKVLSKDREAPGTSDLLLHEARAASALNHPNICTVHEVREEAGRVFIVMEYVDGRPLSQLVPVGGLVNESVLRYGIQIADALGHAHDHGVLHRDLKSANVIVTREGRTKIVDFGLARRFGQVSHEADTRSNMALDADRTAGTLAYMAPELLQGEPPSILSDLWSLGVVLYEMAAGTLPFTGRTVFDETAAILRAPLPPLPTHVPAGVRMIIARCLTKDPGQRYLTARELRAALEAVQSDVAIEPVAPRVTPARWIADWRVLAAGVAAAILTIVGWRMARDRVQTTGSGRLVQVVSSDREASDPAISPDGTMVAYSAADETGRIDLFVSRVAGGARVRLTNDDGRETRPRFSPDGERIAFARWGSVRSNPDICVVPTLGGQVSVILPGASQPAWAPDGQRIAFIRYGDGGKRLILATARIDGSNTRDIFEAGGAYPSVRNPAWSPDGRQLVFVRGSGGIAGEIWLTSADGSGAPHRLSADPAAVFSDEPMFSPDGRRIVHASNRGGATNIWATPVDGGPAVRLTSGSGPDESPTVDGQGRVAFITARWRHELILANMRTGAARTLVRHSPFLWAPSFAPTGRVLAYSRSEVDGSWHIWITDVDAGAPRRLTTSDRGEVYPRWTPDGRFVLFQNWSPPRRIWRVAPDGGPPVPLTAENRDASYADVSPDGRQLAFVITDAPQERVYVMPITGDEGPRLLRDGPASLPRWSPDGAWIAFAPNRGDFGGILIVRPDGTGERRLTDSGGWPVWWPDGTRISYVTVRPDASQQIQTVTLDGAISIPPVPIRFSSVNNPFDIARDGESLVTTNAVHVSSEIWVLEPGA
jgi:Tol biopolymer transport system component/predicted Ser/Thr protein kinase